MKSRIKSHIQHHFPNSGLTRQQFYFLFLGCFIIPLFGLGWYCMQLPVVFFLALFFGSAAWYLLRFWERKMQKSVSDLVKLQLKQYTPTSTKEISHLKKELHEVRRGYEHQIDLLHSSVAKSKEETHQLHLEMDKKLQQMRLAYLEFEDLRKDYYRLEEEYLQAKEAHKRECGHKDSLNMEYQKTIAQQRMIIESKQQYIKKLEKKNQELMSEIRSLLELEGSADKLTVGQNAKKRPASAGIPYDLSMQLHRLIKKAESETGVEHLGGRSPRFLDLSNSYVLDRRRLFDSLREENIGVLFILSLAEKNFLFVNPHVKVVLGWSPEKFIQEFPRLNVRGYANWKKALLNIKQTKECYVPVVLQSKIGEHLPFLCVMGLINKGPFSNHVMGMLKREMHS